MGRQRGAPSAVGVDAGTSACAHVRAACLAVPRHRRPIYSEPPATVCVPRRPPFRAAVALIGPASMLSGFS